MSQLEYRTAEIGRGRRESLIIRLDSEAGHKVYGQENHTHSLIAEGRAIDSMSRYVVCMTEGSKHQPHHGYSEERFALGNVHFDGNAIGRLGALLHFIDGERDFISEIYKENKPITIPLAMIPFEKGFELWMPETLATLEMRKAADEINLEAPFNLVEDSNKRYSIQTASEESAIQPAQLAL